jgi:hypothetical protein
MGTTTTMIRGAEVRTTKGTWVFRPVLGCDLAACHSQTRAGRGLPLGIGGLGRLQYGRTVHLADSPSESLQIRVTNSFQRQGQPSGVGRLCLESGSAMMLCSTRLVPYGSKQRALALSKPRESCRTSREQTPPFMIDFQSLRASLASVFIVPPRERTKGLKGRSEGGCGRRFSLAMALRYFSTSLAALWAAEPSSVVTSVVTKGSVAVWGTWEARERW